MSCQEYLEVVDTILKLAIEADSRNTRIIVQLSRWTRKRYFEPLRLQIIDDDDRRPLYRGQVVVRHKRLNAFIRDVAAFAEVFKGDFTFGEIDRVSIAVALWDYRTRVRLSDVLSTLPIEYLKVQTNFVYMEIRDIWTFVGTVGAKVQGVRVLHILFDHEPEYLGNKLIQKLPSFKNWHRQHVFNQLSSFTSVTTLKIRTPLAMFPGRNWEPDTLDTRGPSQKKWSSTIFETLPSLTMLFVSEGYSEHFGTQEQEYEGGRVLWWKKNGTISETDWDWPGNDGKKFRWGKTTRKVDFDPWETDEEVEYLDEHGWLDTEE